MCCLRGGDSEGGDVDCIVDSFVFLGVDIWQMGEGAVKIGHTYFVFISAQYRLFLDIQFSVPLFQDILVAEVCPGTPFIACRLWTVYWEEHGQVTT